MSDHFDTVRKALGLLSSLRASGERGTESTDRAAVEAIAALDALVSERDKLQHDLDRMRVELVRVDRLRREAERRIPTGDGCAQ